MYCLAIKSGTSNWYDDDYCDKIIAKVPSSMIPEIGEHIEIYHHSENKGLEKYLVNEIKRCITISENNEYNEYVYVYIIEMK